MADVVTEIPRSDKEDINAVNLCDFLDLDRTTKSQISPRGLCDGSNGAGKSWAARGEGQVDTYHIQSLLGLDLDNGEEMVVGIPHVVETRQVTLDVKGSHGKGTAEASLADWGEFCGLDELLGVFDRVQQGNDDAVGAGVEGAFDHPSFVGGDANYGRDSDRCDGMDGFMHIGI